MHSVIRRSWASFALTIVGVGVVEAQRQRPLVVDDLLEIHQLATVAVSPDGQWLAVVITRPRSTKETYRIMPYRWDLDHADIWLLPRRGGESRNLTNGAADGSGYWNPVWSPDGKRIAMLSTKGGDNIRPYVWDAKSGGIRRLTERGVDPVGAFTEESYPWFGMIWRDSTTLLLPVLPAGEAAPYNSKLRTYREAIREWSKAEKGAEPSVSVLESGREIPAGERPTGQLLAVNAVSGESRVLAEGNFRRLLLSPMGRHLALIAETGRVPPPPLLARADFSGVWRTRLAMLGLHEGARLVWIDSIYDLGAFLEAIPHRWSPDGSLFAAIGKSAKEDSVGHALFVVSPETNRVRRLTDERLEVSATTWSGSGELLALTRDRRGGDTSSRSDWVAIDRRKGGPIRNLTAGLDTVPGGLVTTPAPDRMLGLAGGELWSIDLRGNTLNVTADFSPEVREIVWPTGPRGSPGRPHDLVVRGSDSFLYRVIWKGTTSTIGLLASPSADADLASFQPEHQLAVFTGTAPNGTFLWIGGGNDPPVSRIVLNQQVREIADTRRLLIDYQGLDGDSLKALVVLPWKYEKNKRYPLVTWVHHGAEILDTTFYGLLDKQVNSSLNLLLLPAHGYALLIPSMPIPRDRAGTDPYLDLPKNVLPAVDRVIQLGISDPTKLGLIGHSYGGYSTYSLVTYTNRFTAAVTLAGPSNLVSSYGTFVTPDRYRANAHENQFFPGWSEGKDSQGQMYAPPWENLWRYLRNSPLYFAERVKTPLMIIHGDMDYVPIQQGEEFFTALYRMGKEAKFVRYLGEGHSVESPANMKDMWQRIFTWFDGHFRGDSSRDN